MLALIKAPPIGKKITNFTESHRIIIFVVRQIVLLSPANSVLVSNEQLICAVSDASGPFELRIPRRRPMRRFNYACWRPTCSGDVRRSFRRETLRVDSHCKASPLKRPCGRQPDNSAPDHRRGSGLARLAYEIRRKLSRAPRECHPRAAVAIIMNQQLVPERFRPDDKTRLAKRPEPYDGPNDPLARNVNGRKAARPFFGTEHRIDCIGRRMLRTLPLSKRRRCDDSSSKRKPCRAQHVSPTDSVVVQRGSYSLRSEVRVYFGLRPDCFSFVRSMIFPSL